MSRKQREYEPIWIALKKNGHVTLQVPLSYVARVKKAVIKEKDADLGFKLLNDNDTYRLKIEYDRSSCKLKFRLVARIGLEERQVA